MEGAVVPRANHTSMFEGSLCEGSAPVAAAVAEHPDPSGVAGDDEAGVVSHGDLDLTLGDVVGVKIDCGPVGRAGVKGVGVDADAHGVGEVGPEITGGGNSGATSERQCRPASTRRTTGQPGQPVESDGGGVEGSVDGTYALFAPRRVGPISDAAQRT